MTIPTPDSAGPSGFSPLRPAVSWVRGLPGAARTHRYTLLALFAVFAAVVAFRLELLSTLPYPPGADAGEQLYATHVFLGTVFPSPPNSPWGIPPLYYFLFYMPLVLTLPVFTGIKLLMAVVPALLVFPSFWLLRKAELSVPFALFGGALVASSESVSFVVSYNAGYTIAGLFFAIFFFAETLAYLQSRSRKDLVLASLFFAATGATHYLVFFYVIVTAIVIGAVALVVLPHRKRLLVSLGLLALGLGLASIVLIPLYYNLYPTLIVLGPSAGALPSNFVDVVVPMSWGFYIWTQSPLSVLDVVVTFVGLLTVIVLRRRTPLVAVLIGMVAGAAAVFRADPANYGRGFVFLQIAFCLAISVFASLVFGTTRTYLQNRSTRAAVQVERKSASPSAPWVYKPLTLSRRSFRRAAGPAFTGLALAFALAFLLLNASYSYAAMYSGIQYYSELNESTVAVLNWIADNTAPASKVFLATPSFYSWVLGYANRMAYAPIPLSLIVTANQFNSSSVSWLASLGQYVSGNGYVAVGESLPAFEGDPGIYLRTPFGWTQLANANSTGTVFSVREGNTLLLLNSANAVVSAVNLSAPCPACVGQNLSLTWPSAGVTLWQTDSVSGQTVSFRWVAESGTLLSMTADWTIFPTNFVGLSYGHVPPIASAPSVYDTFSLYGAPFALNLTGSAGSFAQSTAATGWTFVSYTGGASISWTMTGLSPVSGQGSFSVNATALFRQLGVNYIVANEFDGAPNFGYATYLRCATPGALPGLAVRQVYVNGGIYVYSVS